MIGDPARLAFAAAGRARTGIARYLGASPRNVAHRDDRLGRADYDRRARQRVRRPTVFRLSVYEGLVLWDLTRTDKAAEIRPGLAESREQDENDKSKWIFHPRYGVKFHDGSDFNADAVIWNLDRYSKPDSTQADPTGGDFARACDLVDRRLPQDRRLFRRDHQPAADRLFPRSARLSVLFEPGAIPEDRSVERVRQVAFRHRAVQDHRIPAASQRHIEPQRRVSG